MANLTDREEALFHAALQHEEASGRAAFLRDACAADLALRSRLEKLLKAHEEAAEFLGKPAAGVSRAILPRTSQLPGEEPGTLIGAHKLLEKIGEGGCGTVYMAEQEQPVRRRVALKIIKLGMDTKKVIARFEAERQALAMMDHPNIAKVLDAGATPAGRPYFAMELVRGVKITDCCDQNRLTTRERLELFIKVCDAVQHAHQKGIIHRDLKPSNILVTFEDGVPVPKVIDFGIAKATTGQRLTDKTVFTAFEQFIGTPAYMSPEQAAMTSVDIDTRSDIYSLGVLLYELLTGRTPFDTQELLKSGFDEMRRIIQEIEPLPPSTRLTREQAATFGTESVKSAICNPQSAIDRDLDWIVMKALEKDRNQRYATVNGLARDMARFLNNEPVVARPPSPIYRFRKFVARNRVMFGAGIAVSLAISVGFAVSTWQFVEKSIAYQAVVTAEKEQNRLRLAAELAKQEEERLRVEAQAQELAARKNAYASDMNLAQQALAANNVGRARELLDHHRPKAGQQDLRGWEWRYVRQQCLGDELFALRPHERRVQSVNFLPDGRLLSGSWDRTVKIWDVLAPTNVLTLWASNAVQAIATSADGKWIAAGIKNYVQLWNTSDLSSRLLKTDATLTAVNFSHDAKRLLGCVGPEVIVWNPEDGNVSERVRVTGGKPVGCALFAPDNSTIILGLVDGRTLVRSGGANAEFRQLPGKHQLITLAVSTRSLALSPDGHLLASAGLDHDVRIWDWAHDTELTNFTAHTAYIGAVAFSPDGKILATAGADQIVKLWDTGTWGLIGTLRGNTDEIFGLAYARDGSTLATGSRDGTVRVWDAAARGRAEDPSVEALHGVLWRKLSPNGKYLLTWHSLGEFRIWQTIPFKQIGSRFVQRKILTFNVFSQDGARLALGFADGTVTLWDLPSLDQLKTIKAQTGVVYSIAFSENAELIATRGSDGILKLWKLPDYELIKETPSSLHEIGLTYFSRDDKVIVAGDASGLTELWEFTGPAPPRSWRAHPESISGIALSPDGRTITTTSFESLVKRWDFATLELLISERGSLQTVTCMAVSPDGRRMVTGGEGLIKVWEIDTLQELATFTINNRDAHIWGVAFHEDGESLVATSNEQIFRWRAPTFAELEKRESLTQE